MDGLKETSNLEIHRNLYNEKLIELLEKYSYDSTNSVVNLIKSGRYFYIDRSTFTAHMYNIPQLKENWDACLQTEYNDVIASNVSSKYIIPNNLVAKNPLETIIDGTEVATFHNGIGLKGIINIVNGQFVFTPFANIDGIGDPHAKVVFDSTPYEFYTYDVYNKFAWTDETFDVLDILQGLLDFAGFIPLLGDVPDTINAVISFARALASPEEEQGKHFMNGMFNSIGLIASVLGNFIKTLFKSIYDLSGPITKGFADSILEFIGISAKKIGVFMSDLFFELINIIESALDKISDFGCILADKGFTKLGNAIDDISFKLYLLLPVAKESIETNLDDLTIQLNKHADEVAEGTRNLGKLGDDLAGLGLDSADNLSRAQKLKAAGVTDENILKVIQDGTPSSSYIQKKILDLDEFKYLDSNQRVAVLSAINDGRVDVSTWTGKLSGELDGITREEWLALDKYMGNGKTVHRIQENSIDKVADFVVDGVNVEFKGLLTETVEGIEDAGFKYAKKSFPPLPEGKNADSLVLDCISNNQALTLAEATEIASAIKAKYPDKIIEIWTSFGDVVK